MADTTADGPVTASPAAKTFFMRVLRFLVHPDETTWRGQIFRIATAKNRISCLAYGYDGAFEFNVERLAAFNLDRPWDSFGVRWAGDGRNEADRLQPPAISQECGDFEAGLY